MAVGDKIIDAEISWRGGHCTGTVEHVAIGWILIRPPLRVPVLKKLTRSAVRSGRLSARVPGNDLATDNVLDTWLEDDDKAKLSAYVRAAMHRHLAD